MLKFPFSWAFWRLGLQGWKLWRNNPTTRCISHWASSCAFQPTWWETPSNALNDDWVIQWNIPETLLDGPCGQIVQPTAVYNEEIWGHCPKSFYLVKIRYAWLIELLVPTVMSAQRLPHTWARGLLLNVRCHSWEKYKHTVRKWQRRRRKTSQESWRNQPKQNPRGNDITSGSRCYALGQESRAWAKLYFYICLD